MTNLERWIAAFEAMDTEAQELALDIADGMAQDWPAPKAKPKLFLVPQKLNGGALLRTPGGPKNRTTPPVVSKPKKV